MKQVWNVGMAGIITYAWFMLIILIIVFSLVSEACGEWLGYTLLFVCGPILLIVNIAGCIFNCLEMTSFCTSTKKSDCDHDVFVIIVRVIVWLILYAIALVGSAGYIFNVWECYKSLRLKR